MFDAGIDFCIGVPKTVTLIHDNGPNDTDPPWQMKLSLSVCFCFLYLRLQHLDGKSLIRGQYHHFGRIGIGLVKHIS